MSTSTPTQVKYYDINEDAARLAKSMNSFSDYTPGSATAGYRRMVDEAAEIAEKQKKRVDPMHHERIDYLLDLYARKLAENMNKSYDIEARVPSVMIAGPANFPVRKKEKQNAARDKNNQEWQHIQGLLDKIRSTGTGGISADDPDAIPKLEAKLKALEERQTMMKSVKWGGRIMLLELKSYQDKINIPLLNDIVGFVLDTAEATHMQRAALYRRCPLLHNQENQFQEKYQFLYLGELLERYEERFGMSKQDLRSICQTR